MADKVYLTYASNFLDKCIAKGRKKNVCKKLGTKYIYNFLYH